MSAAASRLELESSPQQKSDLDFNDSSSLTEEDGQSLAKLQSLSPPSSSGPVIAVDLDDVLSQTNIAVAHWHNEVYGTKMDLSMFYYYYYWKNPLWGTPAETFEKVKTFYSTDRIYQATPVPGAREGTQALKDMGFRLIIVTARTPDIADDSWTWVTKHFPGIFDSIICTGQFKDALKKGHEILTKLSKAQVCADLNAKVLIDDSVENALDCTNSDPPMKVLLFGDYQWNKHKSGPGDHRDEMSFDRRLEAEGGREFWKNDLVDIPRDGPIIRVKDWAETVRYISNAQIEGRWD